MDTRTTAQDVMRCDKCETAIVQMHCDTCLINLCKACVGEHILADESKDHKVVKFQSRNSTPIYPNCASHEKEQCEMYCRPCDIPVCQTCLASDEHLGHPLSKISEILNEKKIFIKKEQNELKETIYATYHDIASDVQNRMSQLERQYGYLTTAITKHGEDWHSKIEELVGKLKTQVEKMKTSQLQTLQKQLDEIKKKIADIKDEIDTLELAADSNDASIAFSVRSNIDRNEKLPPKLVLSVPKFTPGTIQEEEFCKLFGSLSSISLITEEHGYRMMKTHNLLNDESSSVVQTSPVSEFHPSVKKSFQDSQTSVKKIATSGNLSNVACIGNDKIWVCTDRSTIALYSLSPFDPGFEFQEMPPSILKKKSPFRIFGTQMLGPREKDSPRTEITTKSGNCPAGISVSRDGDLIYTDYIDRTVNIVKNRDIKDVIRLQNWRPLDVCITSNNDILITMESDDKKQSKVVRYSDSTEKHSIQFDDKGNPLFSTDGSHKYICENRNLNICVADSGAKAIIAVNQSGKLRFKYTGHTAPQYSQPFSLRGISTDSQGNILTIDDNNKCVHILDHYGIFNRFLVNSSISGILRGLCTDTDDNLFLLSCSGSPLPNEVVRIKYLK